MFDTTIRRLRLAIAPVLVAGGLALAQPTLAADYCVVGPADPCSGTKLGDLQTALDAAAVDNLPDRIFLGAEIYNAPAQGFIYDPAGGGPVEIAGAGTDKTILTGASGAYRTLAVFGGSATSVHDLRVKMPPNAPTDAQALRTNGVMKNVFVTEDHAQQQNVRTGVVLTGSGVFEDGFVALDDGAQTGTLGALLVGGGTIRTTTVFASRGVASGGGTIDRANIGAEGVGVDVRHGTTKVTSTRVRTFGDGSIGIVAGGSLDGDALVEIDGVSLVGPDNPTSGTAIEVDNAYVPTVKVDAVVKNTVMRLYPNNLSAGGYAPGRAHIAISYSDYDSSAKAVLATGAIDESNVSYVGDAGFFDLELLTLLPDSPLVDAGDPATGQGLDYDGNPLVTDGNGDGVARRDIGAIENPGVPLKPSADIPPAAGGDQTGQPVDSPVTPARDTVAPALTGLRLTRKVFAVGRARTAIAARAARGTRVAYTLSENAKVVVKIQRVGTKRAVGKLTRTAKSGRNALAFSGRIGAKALRPGRYRAVITAIDAAGNRSAPKSVRFRIATR